MKYFSSLLFAFLLLKAAPGRAQSEYGTQQANDSLFKVVWAYTDEVDRISRTDSFYHDLNGAKTQFFYLSIDGQLVGFYYKWLDGRYPVSFNENRNSFYLKNRALYCASEEIASYYEDEPTGWHVWSVFKNGKEVAVISLGHGKTESDEWNSEKELKQLYQQGFAIVQQYRLAHASHKHK